MVRHKKDSHGRGKRHPNAYRPPRPRDGNGNTEEGSKPSFKAACWDFEHCDAKRCSGKRLMRLGMMRELHVGQKFSGVVISPKAKTIVSPADKELLEQFGAAVVECSWKRVDEVPFAKIGGKCERLPNPTNYGRPWRLNCVEALAACYFICGHEGWAQEILSTFSYGEAFLEINDAVLRRYAACTSEEEVKSAESAWLQKIEQEYNENRELAKEGEGNAWGGGNLNRRRFDVADDDDGDKEGGKEGENEDDEDGSEDEFEQPELPELSDDEEEMADIRRRVLQSRTFANPDSDAKKPPPVSGHQAAHDHQDDTDPSSTSGAEEDDDFDDIIKATPMTDRTGIAAKERARQLGRISCSNGSMTLSISKDQLQSKRS